MKTKLTNIGKLKAEIAETLPISKVAEDVLEVDLLHAGVQQKGCCPLHQEDTPSFYVNDSKGEGGLFHCFGCKQGGDAITLVQSAKNIGFVEALELLAEHAGLDLSKYQRPLTEEEQKQEAMRSAAETWISALPLATDASTDRIGEDIADRLGIGWSDGPPEGAPLPDYLFKGIIFPYRSPSGKLVGWKCRAYGEEKKHFAVPRDAEIYEPTLFGIQEARAHISNGTIVVVEGEFDCAVCHEAGFENVVATGGSAFTQQHMDLLEGLKIQRVIFAFDGDEGGRTGLDSVTSRYWDADVQVLVAELPEGEDPEDVIKEGIEGVFRFADILNGAKHALEWLLWQEWQSKPRTSLSEKFDFLEWIRQNYGSRLDNAAGSLVAQEVAKWMGLSESEVLDQFRVEKADLQDTDSERVLLSRSMSDQAYFLDLRRKISTTDFFMVRHQRLWQALEAMLAEGLEFDVTTVKQIASEHGVDPNYVDQVAGTGTTNLGHHEERVSDLAVRREAQASADRFRERIADLGVDSTQAIGDLTLRVTNKALGHSKRGAQQIGDQVDHAMETLHGRMRNPTGIHGLDLGSQFPVFTASLQGFQPGRLVLIAAASGVGKSTLSLQLAGSLAIHQSVPVDFVSLEMEEDELLFKLAAHLTGINGMAITGGTLSDQEAKAVEQAMAKIKKAPLRLWAPDDITPSEFQLFARESVLERRTEVLFLDYAQLVAPEPGMERESNYDQLGFLGRISKMKVARAMGVTVVFAAQLKREAADKERPTKEDVGDSYNLARTADVFLILKENHDSTTVDFWIDKNRQGPNNILMPLIFDKASQTFYEGKGAHVPDYRIKVSAV